MDGQHSRVLLALRRFIGVPLPGTQLRIQGLLRSGNQSIRVYVAEPGQPPVAVDLPAHRSDESGHLPPWWYVGALRDVALWLLRERPEAGTSGVRVVDAKSLLERGVLTEDIQVDAGDALDFIISDLTADPLWHDAAASADPDLYTLVGFNLHRPDTVRVYLEHGTQTIGVDLATAYAEDGSPRVPGWWASTKLIAILNPLDEETLAAHKVHDAVDPHCVAVFDLTRWA